MEKIVDISMPRKTLREKLRFHCDAVMKKLLPREEQKRKPMATRKPQPVVVPMRERFVAFSSDRVIVDDPNNEPTPPRAA